MCAYVGVEHRGCRKCNVDNKIILQKKVYHIKEVLGVCRKLKKFTITNIDAEFDHIS